MQDLPRGVHELLLKGGRVIDPASSTDSTLDVGFANGMVAVVAPDVQPAKATRVLDARGKVVVPGLVDIHAHVYWGGTSLGVDAESLCRRSGATTCVDAGSAGAGNFPGFRRFIVDRTRLHILAFLNVSFAGIFGFGRTMSVGECCDMRLLDPDECQSTIEANPDVIVGLKVRLGREASCGSGLRPLHVARAIADRTNMPIMTHVDLPPPDLRDVLPLLRSGDIWTHCFRGPPNSITDQAGDLEEAVLRARDRGVLLDVGHGLGSFSHDVAHALVRRGIYPDFISSDIHAFNVNGPVFDILHVASKFLNLGMSLEDVIERVSSAPAQCIGHRELGRLSPGAAGDAVVLTEEHGAFEFTDSHGRKFVGDRRLRADAVVLGGRVLEPAAP